METYVLFSTHLFERAEPPDSRHAISDALVMSAISDEIVFNLLQDEFRAHLFWLPQNQWSHLVALTPERGSTSTPCSGTSSTARSLPER
jgi:hypothetical protein